MPGGTGNCVYTFFKFKFHSSIGFAAGTYMNGDAFMQCVCICRAYLCSSFGYVILPGETSVGCHQYCALEQ